MGLFGLFKKKTNKFTRRISNHNSEDFLNRTRIILTESGVFKQENLDSKYKLLFCLHKENTNLSKFLNKKVQKEYEDKYAVYIDSENGTLILSHAKLIQLGAASTDHVEYVKVISFDEMRQLLLCELEFYKSLVEKWKNENDIQRSNSCQEAVEKLEKIISTNESDWKDLLDL